MRWSVRQSGSRVCVTAGTRRPTPGVAAGMSPSAAGASEAAAPAQKRSANRSSAACSATSARGVTDHGLDLAAVSDDPDVEQQPLHVGLTEAGHDDRIEPGEDLAEGRPLGQHGAPRQPGLEALQADPLEQALLTGDGPAPLLVVVAPPGAGRRRSASRVQTRPNPARSVPRHHREAGLDHVIDQGQPLIERQERRLHGIDGEPAQVVPAVPERLRDGVQLPREGRTSLMSRLSVLTVTRKPSSFSRPIG